MRSLPSQLILGLILAVAMKPRLAAATSSDLAATAYLDIDHTTLREAVAHTTRDATEPREQAVLIHDFVRDQIRFGWAPAFYRQKASEVLASGIGYCNTKSTLFVAMLRAAGIPTRQHFVNLDAAILHGLISPGTRYVDHSFAEVLIEGRWLRVDSYIVDRPLAIRAKVRLDVERRLLGYGVHRNGVSEWDGHRDAFSQFVNDGQVAKLSTADHGLHADVGVFYDSGLGVNRLSWPMRLVFGWLAESANDRIEQLRSSNTTED